MPEDKREWAEMWMAQSHYEPGQDYNLSSEYGERLSGKRINKVYINSVTMGESDMPFLFTIGKHKDHRLEKLEISEFIITDEKEKHITDKYLGDWLA